MLDGEIITLSTSLLPPSNEDLFLGLLALCTASYYVPLNERRHLKFLTNFTSWVLILVPSS
jgi:hypothetical protein